MSGGRWNYEQYQLEELLKEIANDQAIRERFPKLSVAFNTLSKTLGEIVHDLDWDLCGDSSIKNDRIFEEISLSKLGILFAVLKNDKLIRKFKTIQQDYEKQINELVESKIETQKISDKMNNDPDWEPLD